MKIRLRKLSIILICAFISLNITNPINAKASWIYTTITTGFQKQERTNWCWVASARNMAVTKVGKVNVVKSQSNVVQIIKGSIKNETGSLGETSKAIKIFNVSCKSSYKFARLSFKTLKEKINKGGGVIMAMQNPLYGGHTILLYGYDSNGKVKVYDPKKGPIICRYTDLRDGKTLSGYSYEQSIYY